MIPSNLSPGSTGAVLSVAPGPIIVRPLSETKLMRGAVPPAEIAQDWKTWKAYVGAVIHASGGGGSLASVAGLEQKSRGAQKRLTDDAFAHCS